MFQMVLLSINQYKLSIQVCPTKPLYEPMITHFTD